STCDSVGPDRYGGGALTAVRFAHCIAAAVAPLLVRRWGRNAFLALAVVPGISAAWALSQLPTILRGQELTSSYTWAEEFSLRLGMHMDALGLVMTLIASGVGPLIYVSCYSYCLDIYHWN